MEEAICGPRSGPVSRARGWGPLQYCLAGSVIFFLALLGSVASAAALTYQCERNLRHLAEAANDYALRHAQFPQRPWKLPGRPLARWCPLSGMEYRVVRTGNGGTSNMDIQCPSCQRWGRLFGREKAYDLRLSFIACEG